MTRTPNDHDQDLALARALIGGNSQTVTNGTGTASLVVAVIAVFAIVVAVCEVRVVNAYRQNDLRDMAQIRARLMQCEQYREQHARRISELEAKVNAHER